MRHRRITHDVAINFIVKLNRELHYTPFPAVAQRQLKPLFLLSKKTDLNSSNSSNYALYFHENKCIFLSPLFAEC